MNNSTNAPEVYSGYSHPDAVTVLTTQPRPFAKPHVLAKRHTPDGTIDFSAGLYFTSRVVPFDGIADLSALLSTLEADPHSCVIRGAPRHSGAVTRRTVHGDDAGFAPAARAWLLIDSDNLVAPAGLDPAAAANEVIARLPEEFHGASFHWQLSSSAVIRSTDKIKIHLWCLLDRPIDDKELRNLALFYTVRPGSG